MRALEPRYGVLEQQGRGITRRGSRVVDRVSGGVRPARRRELAADRGKRDVEPVHVGGAARPQAGVELGEELDRRAAVADARLVDERAREEGADPVAEADALRVLAGRD